MKKKYLLGPQITTKLGIESSGENVLFSDKSHFLVHGYNDEMLK